MTHPEKCKVAIECVNRKGETCATHREAENLESAIASAIRAHNHVTQFEIVARVVQELDRLRVDVGYENAAIQKKINRLVEAACEFVVSINEKKAGK